MCLDTVTDNGFKPDAHGEGWKVGEETNAVSIVAQEIFIIDKKGN